MDFLHYFDYKEALRQKNVRYSIAAFGLVAIGASVYFVYKYNDNNRQRLAQRSFSEAIDTYKNIAFENGDSVKDKKAKWEEAELAFNLGYEQNKKSNISPFFLVYESDVQLKLGKYQEAYDKLSQAVAGLAKGSAYYYLYKNKQALVQLDKINEQEGLKQLLELSNDKNNTLSDMSNFYLGEYYWSINNIEQAKKHYQLALAFNPESSWAILSKNKLEKFK